MQAFTTFRGTAIPLMLSNIDTDRIIPKQYLKTVKRSGLGRYLFDEMRYTDAGFPDKPDNQRTQRQDFILNLAPYNKGGVLLSGANFACGSSREHAVWALMDFGIRVVIAPSFADIFFTNCVKNGLLTVELPLDVITRFADLATQSPGYKINVDLAQQALQGDEGEQFSFNIDATRKKIFLEGLDDVGVTLQAADKITQFEEKHNRSQPWLQQGIH